MRFGLLTPVVTGHAAHGSPWEESAGPAEISRIAVAADRLGYHHLTCSEHVAIPREAVAARGSRYYDPLATLAFIAGQTSRIRLATHVVVLPYHHPVALAKRYGTLDRLSGGRLVLGVGVGTLEEEFALLDVPFAGRGPRYEDALRALRAALGQREPRYAGSHHRFDGVVVDPHAVQPHVPIWLGGRTARSLRRALTLADGWAPFGLPPDRLAALIATARKRCAWPRPFDVVLAPDTVPDPTTVAGRTALAALIGRYRTLGATILNLRFTARDVVHYLDQMDAFIRSSSTT